MSKTFFDISPVNNADYYSWSAGLPLIRFNLANTDTTITKLKLQGELVVMNGVNPVILTTDTFQMNQRSGAGSLLNQITVTSAKQSQQLESIRACHRLSVALNSQMNDDDDFVNHLCYELAPNNQLTQRRMITSGVGLGADADNATTNQRKRCHFSIELNSGILQSLLASGGINLSENLFGGLILELELNNAKTLLFGASALANNYEVRIYKPRLRGSSITDLPAPVSPVITLRPELSSSSHWSTVVKFRTHRWVSIKRLFLQAT